MTESNLSQTLQVGALSQNKWAEFDIEDKKEIFYINLPENIEQKKTEIIQNNQFKLPSQNRMNTVLDNIVWRIRRQGDKDCFQRRRRESKTNYKKKLNNKQISESDSSLMENFDYIPEINFEDFISFSGELKQFTLSHSYLTRYQEMKFMTKQR